MRNYFCSIFGLSFIVFCFCLSACSSLNSYYDNLADAPPITESSKLDPDKCYVKTIKPDIYSSYTEEYLSYSAEEAKIYPHEELEVLLQEGYNKWEYKLLKDCQASDPNDCMALCVVEHPARYATIWIPLDSTLGQPSIRAVEIIEIEEVGGTAEWQEIDCRNKGYVTLPVLFGIDSYTLSEDIKTAVDQNILNFMQNNPNVRIEIACHTNTRGDNQTNFALSQQRAELISDYLIEKGIPERLLTTRGFGEAKIVNRCREGVDCTEMEHNQNDRIEFRAVSRDR